MTQHIIAGTAGHIDHGKTELIKALTSIDTDRLDEEKERGITIDLGFAPLELENDVVVSFVDVPGHEDFVKNTLAGMGGIRTVILVIAADESIQEQTVEHFNICELLGIENGIVVLTKIDRVEDDICQLVKMEVEDFTEGSFLEDSPIIPVNSLSGEGINKVETALKEMTEHIEPIQTKSTFWMPVDRAFTLKGFGTIVTGTAMDGSIKCSDKIEILPSGTKSEIRNIQVHNRDIESAKAGQRTALNLKDVEVSQIPRGSVIAKPGFFEPTTLLDTTLKLLENSPVQLEDMDRIRFHHGSTEVMGRVRLAGREVIYPGEVCGVQFRLEEEVVLLPEQRYVIRRYSPPVTIGGGQIIDNLPVKKTSIDEEWSKKMIELSNQPAEERLNYYAGQYGPSGMDKDEMIARLALPFDEVKKLTEDNPDISLLGGKNGAVISNKYLKKLKRDIRNYLADYHEENPLHQGIPRKELKTSAYNYGKNSVFDEMIRLMEKEGNLKIDENTVSLPDFSIDLGEKEKNRKKEIEQIYKDAKLSVPSVDEIIGQNSQRDKNLIQILLRENKIIQITQELLVHSRHIDTLIENVKKLGKKKDVISVGDFKEMTGLSRKYAIPLLEYLDDQRITRRTGDGRKVIADTSQ